MSGETMQTQVAEVAEAAGFLARRWDLRPHAGLMTGTGLGLAAGGLAVDLALSVSDIPHFPVPTVQSHPGRLLLGRLMGRPVAAMQGRLHLYEGYTPLQVTFPVRLMRALGAGLLVLTNAAGGLARRFAPGDIMAVTDHINLTGESPLVGPNAEAWGPRFPDMARVYDPELADIAGETGRQLGLPMQSGVYAGLKGPSLETPAEVRYLAALGADAVGFSTVQETIAAVHGGFRVVALSVITNVHDPDSPAPATLEEIIAVAERAAPGLQQLIAGVVAAAPPHA